MTVNVGLGTGSRDQLLKGAQIIGQIQLEMAKNGLMGRTVTEQNIYNFGREVAEAVMPRKSELFFTDPKGLPPPEQKPDEKAVVQMEKAKMADKTKRDLAAIELLKFVADASKPDNSANTQRESQLTDQSFQRDMKSQEQDFARQERQGKHEQDMEMKFADQITQVAAQFNEAAAAMTSAHEQIVESQKMLMQSMQQLAKIAGAERELVTDDQGNPVRSRPVMENAQA
jgi:hypothetical protein